ncbi:MAG: hypothetical protein WD229_07490, partial [Pirellulales bacterium]
MEGRLMLSTTTVDTMQLFVVTDRPPGPTVDRAVRVAALIEGGYLTLDSPRAEAVFATDAWQLPSTVSSQTISAFSTTRSNALFTDALSSEALHDLILNSSLGSSGDIWTVGDADSTFNGTSGLPAAVIGVAGEDLNVIPTPVAMENSESTSRAEGGWISIESILEGMRDVGEGIYEGSRTALIADAPEGAIEPSRLTASPTKEAVWGELERAIVFEIAGGDPVGIGQSVTHDGSDNANRTEGRPLSFRSTQQPSAERSPKKVGDAEAQKSSAPESGDLTSAVLEHPDLFVRSGNWVEIQASLANIISETEAEFLLQFRPKVSSNL